MKVAVIVQDTGLGHLGNSSANEVNVILAEGFEVARTGCQSTAAGRVRRLERLVDPRLLLQLFLHVFVRHFPEGLLDLRPLEGHQLTLVDNGFNVMSVFQIFVRIGREPFSLLQSVFNWAIGFESANVELSNLFVMN